MQFRIRAIWFAAMLPFLPWTGQSAAAATSPSMPNIVFILADDLGYGDLSSYGATLINTPHMDRLAKEGMRFTDAHSPHSVCTPTRYGLLTGQYAWRTWNGHMTVWSDDPLLIDTRRMTVPKMLKAAGYATAIIGKWHLGFGAPGMPGWDDMKGPDYNGELKPGPLEVGFDYFFGIPHVGQHPHILIENHRVVGLDPADPIRIVMDPNWTLQKRTYYDRLGVPGHEFTGGAAAFYRHEDLAITLTERAVKWLEQQRKQPFFLYFAHRNPHGPIIPNPRFKGSSEIGPYGDFVHELDWSVGEVLSALDRLGLTRNTLVILSSDNGGVATYFPSRVAEINGHRVNGPLFGQKTEAYEGGTRVPLVVRWPGVVKPGTETQSLVALTDVLATVAELTGSELPATAGEDSFSFLANLRQTPSSWPARTNLVTDSHGGTFAIREDRWKLIDGPGGGGIFASADSRHVPVQLYDIVADPGERHNLHDRYPQRVSRLQGRLREIQLSGRSR